MITKEQIAIAQQCLIDNGIKEEKSATVLQTLGHILINKELFSDKPITKLNDRAISKTKETITIKQIERGIQNGVIRFISDPNMGYGTVCEIGDYWFYFGGESAGEEEPEDYVKNVPLDDLWV